MGMYDRNFVASVLARYPEVKGSWAIETGTCLGYSTRILAKDYERVLTVDIAAELSEKTATTMRNEGVQNVEFFVGDSARLLPKMLARVSGPGLLFLDAHWSGDASVDWSRSGWKGYGVNTGHRGEDGGAPSSEAQVPLLEELTAIERLVPTACVVYVDDFELFDAAGKGIREKFPGQDWSHLSVDVLKAACRSRLREWIVTPDGYQLAIVLGPKVAS